MNNNLIAHISDVHIRFGSRHPEYQIVFDRTIDSLKELQPRRIVITGDLFHIKINLSPNAIKIAGNFLKRLAQIAPVDVSPGNHDWNSQSPAQGNSIEAIVDLISNGYIITKDIKKLPVPEIGYGIYFYKESGFYEVDKELIYGVYSCLDSEILTLIEKKKTKKYIALYHGPIYGCISDNGYEMKGDELVKPSTFNNFDMVFLGDIHEHQAIKKNICYPGSLLQQSLSEGLNKGYLIWKLDKNTFERRLIPNDYGFSKLNLSPSEDIEKRIREMPLSFDPKKTKVTIEYEDYEENYSVELLKQIEHIVKKIHKCEVVNVEYVEIKRETVAGENGETDADLNDSEQFEVLLKKFLEEKSYDNIDDVLELSKEIDQNLNLDKTINKGMRWEAVKMVAKNLYMFPDKEIVFDFDKMKGITGIIGENYSGKSNVIRALVWILYKKMLGGGTSNKLVNMYTKSNKGYGEFWLKIASELYRIIRTVSVKETKKGEPEVSYGIAYEKMIDGVWTKEDSDENATQKREAEKVITEAIGTFEDFVKVVLKSQSNAGGYLTLSQQPKNDLVNKYLGLEVYRLRHEFANETFKKVKLTQKSLGDPIEIEGQVKLQNDKIAEEKINLEGLNKEKKEVNDGIDGITQKILDETKKLTKIENLKETNEDAIKQKLLTESTNKQSEENQMPGLEQWLKINFKKEVPKSNLNLSKAEIESKLEKERKAFQDDKIAYSSSEEWLKNNKKQSEIDTKPIEDDIFNIKQEIINLNNTLTISKGKKCPTCGHVSQNPNPQLQKECEEKIEKQKEKQRIQELALKNAKGAVEFNNNIDKKTNDLASLKISLTTKKQLIDTLKEELDLSSRIAEIVKHNNEVESKSQNLEKLRKSLIERDKQITYLNEQSDLLSKNKQAILQNAEIQVKIDEYQQDIKVAKTRILQLDEKIKDSASNTSVAENNIQNYTGKLETLRSAEKIYKKYSIYMQAVHRDGIPAQIIRKKMPLINHRINNLLRNIVEFKIELNVETNGDISEVFYFGECKKHSLPMDMSSGSQGFLGSVAIQDALHFVSKLSKPSLCMIDEGFGTLDEKHTMDIGIIFNYFRTRYKNTLIMTHKNEIKDFVDNIIMVNKSTAGLTDEQLQEDPHAGISGYEIL